MNPILPLFGKNSNLINQDPVTSVDKLVCTFDKCTSYIPRVCVCVCVRARNMCCTCTRCGVCVCVCVWARVHIRVCVCVCVHCFCHCIKITYCNYFIVYRTITLPTVLLVFVYMKLLSLNERITQTNEFDSRVLRKNKLGQRER